MHFVVVCCIKSSKLFSHDSGNKQSASVVTIHSYFAEWMAVVIASFFGACVFRSLLIIEMSVRVSRLKRNVSSTFSMIFTELSFDSSSTKITSNKLIGYFKSWMLFNKVGRFSASFLKGTITVNVVFGVVSVGLKKGTLLKPRIRLPIKSTYRSVI